jgi:hypothetical protein
MEKSSQIAWKIVPLRHLFPLKLVPLIEVLLYVMLQIPSMVKAQKAGTSRGVNAVCTGTTATTILLESVGHQPVKCMVAGSNPEHHPTGVGICPWGGPPRRIKILRKEPRRFTLKNTRRSFLLPPHQHIGLISHVASSPLPPTDVLFQPGLHLPSLPISQRGSNQPIWLQNGRSRTLYLD